MYKLLLYGIATAVLALVILFIIVFFIDINKVKLATIPLQTQEQSRLNDQNQTSDKDAWIDRTQFTLSESYYYPVTEVSIHADLLNNVDNKFKNRLRTYQLKTQKLSDYHYFCLKQVLDQSLVHHKVERYKNEIGVILYSNNEETLKNVVNELNKYGIKSTLSEIKEVTWKNLE